MTSAASGAVALTQERPEPPGVTADRVMSVRSVVGGEAPQWVPDGSGILFASTLGGEAGLWVVSPDGGFPRQLPVGIGGVAFLSTQQPHWSPTGDRVAYVSAKSGAAEIWVWSAADGRDRQLTALGARINSWSWSPDGQWIAFADDRYGNYDIYKVSASTGETYRITKDTRYEVFPSWTPDARSIVYVRLDERWADHDVMIVPAAGGEARVVVHDSDFFDYGAGTGFGYVQISPDGRTTLFRSHRSGWINYWKVPLGGGEATPVAPEAADQAGARWSPDGQSILYTANHNGTVDLRVAAASGGAPRAVFAPAIGVVRSAEWSPDGKRISFVFGTPTTSADLYVVAREGGAPRQLTFSTPQGIPAGSLVQPEKIAFQSDSFTISGYLYKPATIRPGERFPAILFIHGGPTGQFSDTYETQVQYLVRQGYVVLLPNIRGSSGYGKRFEDANNGCWERCDLRDVLAGGEYLKRLPYVNGAKMGITGTSYGGIMSMAAAAFAPGYFQASIPQSGYGDWLEFMRGDNELRHIKLMEYEFGPFETNEPKYREASPIYWVRDVSTPMFLVQGEGRYPHSPQSRLFAAALEKNYKVYRLKVYQGEPYYVTGRENSRQVLLDMSEFFDQFLKDRVTP